MSLDGIQNSYLNYGFDLNAEETHRPIEERSINEDNMILDSGAVSSATDIAAKVEINASSIHYFKRHPKLSEETSLLRLQDEVSVAYFIQPNKNDPFRTFKLLHASVTFSDCLHKIVYFCLIADFVLFAKRYLQCDAPNAIITTFAVISCCLLISAAFSVSMDLCAKKVPIICFGFIAYIIGISALAWLTASISTSSSFRWWSILALFLICLGEASTRTLLPDFGVINSSNIEAGKMKLYAWKLHWVSNFVIIVAIAFITAMDQNVNFESGFYISIAIVVWAFILFLIPLKNYKMKQIPHIGALRTVHNVLTEAKAVKKGLASVKKSTTYAEEESANFKDKPSNWIDFAMFKYGGTYEEPDVNEVKCIYDVTILFFCLIPYWIVHAQCYTTYYYQGIHLDAKIANTTFPVAWLSLVTVVTVMLLTPFLDKVVYPALESRNIHFPIIWRIIFGMVFACISVIIAGCIEFAGYSKKQAKDVTKQSIGILEVTAVKMSIFVLLPQYVFLGLSEVFVGLTALSIAHRLCTGGFKRLANGMYFITMSAGHLLALVVTAFGWYPNKDYFMDTSVASFFFVLAGFMIINIIVFAIAIYRTIDIPSRLQRS